MKEQYREKEGWTIRNGVPGFDLSTLPRCSGISKTGKPCQRAVRMGSRFCGIHSGKCSPGSKKGAKGPVKHGFYKASAVKDRVEASSIMKSLRNVCRGLTEINTSEKGKRL